MSTQNQATRDQEIRKAFCPEHGVAFVVACPECTRETMLAPFSAAPIEPVSLGKVNWSAGFKPAEGPTGFKIPPPPIAKSPPKWKCEECGGRMRWCDHCNRWSRVCCVPYGTCQCS